MAFSVRIVGFSKGAGKVLLEMEPQWWDADQLQEDDRFIASNDTGSYFDFDADMSVEEMKEIHERFRPAATSGVFENDEWQEIIQPKLKNLDEALYSSSGNYSHFHINVFEWESGLG